MPQPIPTARGAEPFKVNHLDTDGEPTVRAFADNADAHRFRASLTPGKDGKLPQVKAQPVESKYEEGDGIEKTPVDGDTLVILENPDMSPPPKPTAPPVFPGMVGDDTPGPKTVTVPVPVVELPDAAKS